MEPFQERGRIYPEQEPVVLDELQVEALGYLVDLFARHLDTESSVADELRFVLRLFRHKHPARGGGFSVDLDAENILALESLVLWSRDLGIARSSSTLSTLEDQLGMKS